MGFDYTDVDYESWENQYNDMRALGPTARHIRRLIFQTIERLEFHSVLDVSCGEGHLLQELALRYPEVALYGTEYSHARLEHITTAVPKQNLYFLDLVKETLPHKYDLVICSDVLEHIAEDQIAIKHLYEMTGRYALITTIQGRFWPYERKAVGHVRSYTRADLETKLSKAGYRILQTYEWGWPFFSPLYRHFLALTQARGTTGTYGSGRRLMASTLYALFSLNSSRRGDELIVLATPESH